MRKLSQIVGTLTFPSALPFALVGLQALFACARPTTHPARVAEPAAEGPAPRAPEPPLPRPTPVAPAAVGAVPAQCLTFVAHPPACAAADDKHREHLALALAQKDALARDARLAALQTCTAFDPGVVLALRA